MKSKSCHSMIIFDHFHRSSLTLLERNLNSISSDTTIDTVSWNSDLLSRTNRKNDKGSKLQIYDHLNKDGSRHNVMHKGSEESIRQRREAKRAKRSGEKKRRIEEKVSKANQRWQKYSTIDYELVFFISRYYDQLPLCSSCRNDFITHRTEFLTDDPRASLDYAAHEALKSASSKTMTFKQAAKARLIKDYDKQTDLVFNLCDLCLTKCENIRNELKEINLAQKFFNESQSPIELMNKSNFQEINHESFLPSSPNLPKPTSQNLPDLQQVYLNNLWQYHQLKLKQLYKQSQDLILFQQSNSSTFDREQLNHDLQSCLTQMQNHCLEAMHLQYPGYLLSFPYTPLDNSQNLTYRHSEVDDGTINYESFNSVEHRRCCAAENSPSLDDRVTIDTCHGIVEYCNAPLDDFIRGIEVLKCLSTFNYYSS